MGYTGEKQEVRAEENKLTDINIGDKVQLTDGVLHKEYAGRVGTVKKFIKCRNAVKVVLADGQIYEAFLQNVQRVGNGFDVAEVTE